MKKTLISLLVSLTLLMGITTPIFSDSFVPSITVRESVKISSNPLVYEPDQCIEELVVTSYMMKETIVSDYSKEQLDEAYEVILQAEKVEDLAPGIIEKAHSLGVMGEDLVVRDLFDITEYEYFVAEGHDEHQHVKELSISLETETLENFVALLVYYDHEWHLVETTSVDLENNVLNFLTDELSPFAIIVATDYRYVAEAHGCIWHLYICITMLLTFILTNIFRRKDAETRDKKKLNILIRDIICLISLILSIIFYIFGTCKYDVYALIIDILVVTITFIYSHPYNNKDEH